MLDQLVSSQIEECHFLKDPCFLECGRLASALAQAACCRFPAGVRRQGKRCLKSARASPLRKAEASRPHSKIPATSPVLAKFHMRSTDQCSESLTLASHPDFQGMRHPVMSLPASIRVEDLAGRASSFRSRSRADDRGIPLRVGPAPAGLRSVPSGTQGERGGLLQGDGPRRHSWWQSYGNEERLQGRRLYRGRSWL